MVNQTWVIQKIRGWKIRSDCWLERISGCCISDVDWQWVPDRWAWGRECIVTFRPASTSGSCGRRVSVLGWSGREGEYSCRRSGKWAGMGGGDGIEIGACISGGFELWLAASGADMTVGVMCTLWGARATEKAAQLGLLLDAQIKIWGIQANWF